MSDVPIPVTADFTSGFDAPDDGVSRTAKQQWREAHFGPTAPTVGASVGAAGGAVAAATGARGPRRAVDTAGLATDLRHNWVVVGPRNVGGRIKALVVHPADPAIMYAGSANGGVWKTIDRGESWFPLWHDEATMSIGAIAISPSNPRVIWVATGEFPLVNGNGVYRSADEGRTWTQHAVPGPANTALQFEAIAADPASDQVAWAVGPQGIFRTSDGGAHWDHFRSGDHFSDVAFSRDPAGASTVFLVRATNAEVVFLSNPGAPAGPPVAPPAGTIRNVLPDLPAAIDPSVLTPGLNPYPALTPPSTNPTAPVPRRGKIAVASGARNIAYLRFADSQPHAGIFRSDDAQPAAGAPGTAIHWRQMFGSPNFNTQNSGWIFLTIATTPDGRNVATGMVDLHVLSDSHQANRLAAPPGGVDPWRRAIAWEIWAADRGHHADQHATVFAPDPAGDGGLALWAGNDGGISRSLNWRTGIGHAANNPTFPVPVRAVRWQKRSEGILATQMYDLTQSTHPSVYGCAFQDNGVFMTNGGPSWQMLAGADGGTVAFDPDDPFRVLVSEQVNILDIHVPGLLNQLVRLRGTGVAPSPRNLDGGFFPADAALFVAETAYDPRRGRRVLHARSHVLYGRRSATGERWQPEPLGDGLELRRTVRNAGCTLRVVATAGGATLGFPPQFVRAEPPPPPIGIVFVQPSSTARLPSLLRGPFRLTHGDTLSVAIDGAAPTVIRFDRAAFADISQATAAEVAAVINAVAPGLAASIVDARSTSIGLVVRTVGADLTVAGSAGTGAINGVFRAGAGGHAVVQLALDGVDLTNEDITLTVGGVATRVDFDDLAHPAQGRQREIVELVRTRLASTAIMTGDTEAELGVAITHGAAGLAAPVGVNVTIAGTGVAPAGAIRPILPADRNTAVAAAPSLVLYGAPWNLTGPPAPTITINDGAMATTFTCTPPLAVADPTQVTAPELQRLLAAHLAGLAVAARPNVTIDLTTLPDPSGDGIRELTIGRNDPDRIWAGDSSGRLYRTTDGGARWTTVRVPDILDERKMVEAIAIHPTDPAIVLVGLVDSGRSAGPPLLFRTANDGASWERVGGLVDTAGQAVPVTAVEFDPDRPDVAFAATDAGVFRSADAGRTWVPFNEGLPNNKAMDLVVEPQTRTLRVGVWGRGVYERHVGDRLPEDVRLVVRANALDTGVRPPLRGPDVMSVPPGIHVTASPDVKVTRLLPAAGAGTLIDGVEFDERIEHEPPTPGPSDVLVQVHNLGAFPASSVRVTAMWAPLVDGRPPLLPAGFPATRAAGTLAVDSTQGAWTVIGDGEIPDDGLDHDVVAAGQPRVRRFAYTWPAAVANQPLVGIVVIVTDPTDASVADERDVERLVVADRHVAYRATPTLRTDDDQVIVIRSTTGASFRIGNPTGGLASATVLGFTLGNAAVQHVASASRATFNLAAGAPSGLRIRMDRAAAVTFDATDGFPVAAATVNDVIGRMLRDFGAQSVPAVGGFVGLRVAVMGQFGSQVAVTGGTAAPTLGLPVSPNMAAFVTGTVNAPFNLSAGAPQDLQVNVRQEQLVTFAQVTAAPAGTLPEIPATPEIPNLAAARPVEIRAAINAQLRHSGMPIVAEPRRHLLVVRRSLTEIGGRGQVLGGEQYADVVASPNVVPAAGRPALFDLATVYGTDRVRRATNNRLYLRSTNLGNVTVTDARHRLWSIDPAAAPPLAPVAIDAAKTATLAPLASAFTEFVWNPGNGAAGTRLLVLAIVDHAPDRATEPPAAFASLDELETFCRTRPNSAVRIVELSA